MSVCSPTSDLLPVSVAHKPPNAEVQPPGGFACQHSSECRGAGPVGCNPGFGRPHAAHLLPACACSCFSKYFAAPAAQLVICTSPPLMTCRILCIVTTSPPRRIAICLPS